MLCILRAVLNVAEIEVREKYASSATPCPATRITAPMVMAELSRGYPQIQAARKSADIIVVPVEAIGRKRRQRVRPLALACGDESPDLFAKPAKQTEKRLPGLPGVVEITYRKGQHKGKHVWFLRYRDPLTGNWTSIKLGEVGVMSYIEMVALAKQYQDDIAAGRSPRSARMSLATFIRLYFEPWVRQNQRSSADTLARLFRYVLPLLGDKSLGDIGHHDGEQLLNSLREGDVSMRFGALSPASRNRILMACRTVFRLAVELGFIANNPFKHVRQLKETPPSPRALESDELDRFLTALVGAPMHFVLLIEFLLATAARINEILELRESDIDYAAGVVHLRTTKAGEAQTLPLTSSVAGVLTALKPLRRAGNPYLFPALRGGGHMSAPYKRLRQVLAAAGLEQAGFHLFRKTVATRAMQLPDMDVLTVSRLLRHKSVRTLEVHYLATPQKRVRQAANDIGEALLARRRGEKP